MSIAPGRYEDMIAFVDGYLEAHHEGRGFTWRDTGLHRVSDHGELEPVDVDELNQSEVAEVVRSSTYTWEFRNSQPEHRRDVESAHTKRDERVAGANRETEEGGPPPG